MGKYLLAAFLAAQSADAGTTAWKIHTGRFHEANPVMPSSAAGIVVTKATITVGTVWMVHRLAVHHPKLARVVLIAGTGSGATGAALNLR